MESVASAPAPTQSHDLYTYALILHRGAFYYPAWKHYDDASVRVVCDRCHRNDFPACIGYERFDLCLPCADAVARLCPPMPDGARGGDPRPPRPLPLPVPLGPEPVLTLMVQPIFHPPATRMMDPRFFRR